MTLAQFLCSLWALLVAGFVFGPPLVRWWRRVKPLRRFVRAVYGPREVTIQQRFGHVDGDAVWKQFTKNIKDMGIQGPSQVAKLRARLVEVLGVVEDMRDLARAAECALLEMHDNKRLRMSGAVRRHVYASRAEVARVANTLEGILLDQARLDTPEPDPADWRTAEYAISGATSPPLVPLDQDHPMLREKP